MMLRCYEDDKGSLKGMLPAIFLVYIFAFSGCTPTAETEIVDSNTVPIFENSYMNMLVDENQLSVMTLNATDDKVLTYSLSGTDADSFDINSSSGVVSFKVAPDYESKSSYSFIATADNGSSSVTQNMTININNINDNPPIITNIDTSTVEENQNTAITMTATDIDNLAALVFSLSGTDADSFDINSSSGVVSFKVAPDYESKNSYSFIATANDGSTSATQSVTINIHDIADMVPILSEFTASIDENVTIGTVVGNIDIVNSGDRDITSFVLSNSTNFDISSTGYISTKTAFNYDGQASYILDVYATNAAGQSDLTTVTININNNVANTYALSGVLTYDYVPVSTSNALDYENTIQKPIRGAKVCYNLVDTSACTYTDDNGNYTFDNIAEYSISLYVYAQTNTITIEDNTNSDAVYVMSSIPVDLLSISQKDINAPSGWSGTNTSGSYTSSRISAPYAILDTLYATQRTFLEADSTLVFPALKVNWSIKNVDANGATADGDIGTSHWDGEELYILGKADSDTDEFDAGVVIHEWGHYFESKLSRSDSIGGSHSSGEIKDMRLAFGEAWGNALAGIMLDDHSYRDTVGIRQQEEGNYMNLESGSDAINPGWFSEDSLQLVLYDIFDSNDDNSDTVSLGLSPIIQVMRGTQINTPAMTSIFTFISGLKAENTTHAAAIDILVNSHNISTIIDDYGTGETHDGGDVNNLPIYHSITKGGSIVSLGLAGAIDNWYNTLDSHRFLRIVGDGAETTIMVDAPNDVGLLVCNRGQCTEIDNTSSGVETITLNADQFLNGTEYIIWIQSWGYYWNDTSEYNATVSVY